MNWTYLNVDPIGEEEDEQEKEPFNVSEAESERRGDRPHTCPPTDLGLALVVVLDSAFT